MADIARSAGERRLAVYWQRAAARHHEEARRHLEQLGASPSDAALARLRGMDGSLLRTYWAHLPDGSERLANDPEAARRHMAALIAAALFDEVEP